MNAPLVSIIIPCRNEEKFIEKCLLSIIANDYPKKNLEIFVVDGQSRDKTRAIVQSIAKKHSYIKLLDNPHKFTPHALNIGIRQAQGEIIMRMDAHSAYQPDYISKCVKYLQKYQADNVGGAINTLPSQDTLIGRSIAESCKHIFGVGNSDFRRGAKKQVAADTVAFGCYDKKVFDRIGLFNENLIRSQDMEFNLRLKRSGGRIMLCPDISCDYYCSSDLISFAKHRFRDGVWSVYPTKFTQTPLSLRHYVPAVFVIGLIIGGFLIFFTPVIMPLYLTVVGLYLFLNLTASLQIAFKKRNLLYLFTMPLIFATLHLSYGFGSLAGLIKILFPIKKHET